MTFELTPIGKVASPLTSLADAPRQADEGAPAAWIEFEPRMLEGLRDLKAGDDVVVLTWLDRARRDVLSVHPRGDASRPAEGVFSTRAPHRPNPVGLHYTTVLAVDGTRVHVASLEALNGTPVIDLKPALVADVTRR